MWIPGILVTGKEVVTKGREPMIFVSFEDEHAIFETVLFPDAFRRFFPMLDDGWAFLVHGRVDEDYGALSIGVERLVKVSRDSGAGTDAAAGAGAGVPSHAAGGVAASRAAAADVVAPDRPPVFAWWSGHGGDGDAEDGEGGAVWTPSGWGWPRGREDVSAEALIIGSWSFAHRYCRHG